MTANTVHICANNAFSCVCWLSAVIAKGSSPDALNTVCHSWVLMSVSKQNTRVRCMFICECVLANQLWHTDEVPSIQQIRKRGLLDCGRETQMPKTIHCVGREAQNSVQLRGTKAKEQEDRRTDTERTEHRERESDNEIEQKITRTHIHTATLERRKENKLIQRWSTHFTRCQRTWINKHNIHTQTHITQDRHMRA